MEEKKMKENIRKYYSERNKKERIAKKYDEVINQNPHIDSLELVELFYELGYKDGFENGVESDEAYERSMEIARDNNELQREAYD